MTKAKTEAKAKATFSSGSVSVTEFAGDSTASVGDYILSSSSSTVEPEQLREKLLLLRAEEQQNSEQNAAAQPKERRGRGQVIELRLDAQEFVLRKYHRGGLVARITRSFYLWAGLKNSRAFRELSLLDSLSKQHIPVCRPEAAWVLRNGIFYQAYLLTERVPNAKTLGELFLASELNDTIMHDAGALIRRMHDANVWHADLNAHNILRADSHCVLIDFDRGRARRTGSAWQQSNIRRLRRSFDKLATQHAMSLASSQWQALLDGYGTKSVSA